MNDSTLPACIGYYGKPMAPNGPCNKCKYEELCKRVVAKERLQPLVSKIVECRKILRGEQVHEV